MKNKMAAAILMIVAVAVFMLLNSVGKASTFEIKGDSLVIGGGFGTTLPLTDITNLNLTETMPPVDKKVNGSGIKSSYKGEFTFQDGSKARLYVDAALPPFITFKQGDTAFYINFDTPEKTREFFDRLQAATSR